ncbi:unnamed protein product [Ilex paraguariensis]|uniref:ENTH domain-containing protein n=1 Tax=Ilex paraguariensis TaxID=185542 RepID=A0ABC8UST8_9AQUA
MPSKLQKAIGAVKDQTSISLAKVASNNSSNLEVAVLKATTHDDVPIDERYVAEVLDLVSSNKVYAAACARAIGKRIGRTRNWIVALKSLVLVLRIFQNGDPYFPREVLHAMKRGAKILNLSSFRDDSNTSPWDFTAFIRTFALYLDERLDCFLTGKLQRRYTHRQRETSHRSRRPNEPVRDMKPAMLLDRISFWQRLLERAIATRPTGAAKTNRLVQISLLAVVQESFDLYKDISDGLALLLDSFFHLQYQSCVNAFQTCVKAAKQFEELGAFYTLCKNIGVGRTSEYPCVQTISEELIETLQEFLKDQSSFPGNGRSPNPRLLLPAPPNPGTISGRHDSYGGQSEFSVATTMTEGYSERGSEFGSQCTSLEDLISATESGIHTPSISIDLEAYSDQFEKKSQTDEAFRLSDTGSTRSLPMSNSMADLVSLGEWPEQQEEQEQKPEQTQKKLNVKSSKNWELELVEAVAPLTQPLPNVVKGFEALPEKEHKVQETVVVDSAKAGWEVVLYEMAATPSTQTQPTPNDTPELTPTSTVATTTNTTAAPADFQAVFPAADILATTVAPANFQAVFPGAETFSSAPTFQAAPTFSAQNTNDTTLALQNENDPFATCSTALANEEMFNGSRNQQNFLHEQQLWLQHQNKIIAKHMA